MRQQQPVLKDESCTKTRQQAIQVWFISSTMLSLQLGLPGRSLIADFDTWDQNGLHHVLL